MGIHEIMENWMPGEFTRFLDGVIERLSKPGAAGETCGRFNDLLIKMVWTSRRIAELDERLAAKTFGLSLEVTSEVMTILRSD